MILFERYRSLCINVSKRFASSCVFSPDASILWSSKRTWPSRLYIERSSVENRALSVPTVSIHTFAMPNIAAIMLMSIAICMLFTIKNPNERQGEKWTVQGVSSYFLSHWMRITRDIRVRVQLPAYSVDNPLPHTSHPSQWRHWMPVELRD